MGMTKQYLLKLLELGDDTEEQDAIEWAIWNNWVTISGHPNQDKQVILKEKPEILAAFRRVIHDHDAALQESYEP